MMDRLQHAIKERIYIYIYIYLGVANSRWDDVLNN